MKRVSVDGACIVAYSSWPRDKIMFWHDWHKQFCPNVKVFQVIEPMSKVEPIQHPDIIPIHLDRRIIYTCGDMLWFDMLSTEYKYFLFMEHDSFCIKPCIEDCLNAMYRQRPEIHCMHAALQTKAEHRKVQNYGAVQKHYGINRHDVRWCHTCTVIMSRYGLEMYHKHLVPLIYSELTVPNIFKMLNCGMENPYMETVTNRSNELHMDEISQCQRDSHRGFIHAVKNYNMLSDVFNFKHPYDRNILAVK